VVARRKKSLVFLDPTTIWAFEAADRLTFVHSPDGKFDIDLSLAAIEASFGRALFRVHRNWLVNLAYVKELERDISGATVTVGSDLGSEGHSIRAPVSQDRAKALRDVLLENATGLRRP
jgi:DNA-binding LytR/AlgR family response regulator